MSNVRIIPNEVEWRQGRVEYFQSTALMIDKTLEQLAELEAIFVGEHDGTVLPVLRGFAGLLRSRRNDRLDLATELRASLHPDGAP